MYTGTFLFGGIFLRGDGEVEVFYFFTLIYHKGTKTQSWVYETRRQIYYKGTKLGL